MTPPLFEIHLRHRYFNNGVFQGCKILADSSTSDVIRRYGMLMHMVEGVFACYPASSDDVSEFLSYLNMQLQGAPLRFLLLADEAQFIFMTDVPLNWVGQVMMDSKSGTAEYSHGETRIRLTQTFSGRTVRQCGVIGMISIHLDDLLATVPVGGRYVVDFRARSLPWRYYLVNRSQTKLNSPMIRDQNQVCLDGPVSMVLPNGEPGLCFSSGAMVFPLQQIPTLIFDLIDRLPLAMDSEEHAIEHCLIHGLPTPDVGELEQAGGAKDVFGAMYVYL